MSVLTLPEPERWSDGRTRYLWACIGCGVMVAVAVSFAVRNLMQGDVLSALVLMGFSLVFVCILAAGFRVSRGRAVLRASADSTGTVLRPDRVMSVLVLTALALGTPVGLIIAVFTFTGDLTMFVSSRGVIGSIVVGTFLAGFAIYGLLSAWRRGGLGYVLFTPDGVEIADIFRTTSVAWRDIVAVTDHADVKQRIHKPVVLERADGSESRIDGADSYVSFGANVYWMVRHYWRHPDERDELCDGRAVQRLVEGRFEVD